MKTLLITFLALTSISAFGANHVIYSRTCSFWPLQTIDSEETFSDTLDSEVTTALLKRGYKEFTRPNVDNEINADLRVTYGYNMKDLLWGESSPSHAFISIDGGTSDYQSRSLLDCSRHISTLTLFGKSARTSAVRDWLERLPYCKIASQQMVDAQRAAVHEVVSEDECAYFPSNVR